MNAKRKAIDDSNPVSLISFLTQSWPIWPSLPPGTSQRHYSDHLLTPAQFLDKSSETRNQSLTKRKSRESAYLLALKSYRRWPLAGLPCSFKRAKLPSHIGWTAHLNKKGPNAVSSTRESRIEGGLIRCRTGAILKRPINLSHPIFGGCGRLSLPRSLRSTLSTGAGEKATRTLCSG